MIAVCARLRCASTSTGNRVPRQETTGWLLLRTAHARVTIDNQPRVSFLRDIYGCTRCRPELNRRQHRLTKMVACAVVDRDGQLGWKRVKVIGSHEWPMLSRAGGRPRSGMATGCGDRWRQLSLITVAWIPTQVRYCFAAGNHPIFFRDVVNALSSKSHCKPRCVCGSVDMYRAVLGWVLKPRSRPV